MKNYISIAQSVTLNWLKVWRVARTNNSAIAYGEGRSISLKLPTSSDGLTTKFLLKTLRFETNYKDN